MRLDFCFTVQIPDDMQAESPALCLIYGSQMVLNTKMEAHFVFRSVNYHHLLNKTHIPEILACELFCDGKLQYIIESLNLQTQEYQHTRSVETVNKLWIILYISYTPVECNERVQVGTHNSHY